MTNIPRKLEIVYCSGEFKVFSPVESFAYIQVGDSKSRNIPLLSQRVLAYIPEQRSLSLSLSLCLAQPTYPPPSHQKRKEQMRQPPTREHRAP